MARLRTAIALLAVLGAPVAWAPDAAADIVPVGVLGTPVFLLAIMLEAVVPLFLPLCPV
jgi:hypothetical protein